VIAHVNGGICCCKVECIRGVKELFLQKKRNNLAAGCHSTMVDFSNYSSLQTKRGIAVFCLGKYDKKNKI
jgi:hypothetical protein